MDNNRRYLRHATGALAIAALANWVRVRFSSSAEVQVWSSVVALWMLVVGLSLLVYALVRSRSGD